MQYVYTNRSTPEELKKYLDDVRESFAVYAETYRPDITVDRSRGYPVEICKTSGVDNPNAQVTDAFDYVTEKHGEAGFFCLNAVDVYKNHPDFDKMNIPSHENYIGLFETDDVSQWRIPMDEFE
jgi:hypothetical protein